MDDDFCNYNPFANVDDGSCNNDGSRMLSITGETMAGWDGGESGVFSPGPWVIYNSAGVPVMSASATAPEATALDTISQMLCAGCYTWEYVQEPQYFNAYDHLAGQSSRLCDIHLMRL